MRRVESYDADGLMVPLPKVLQGVAATEKRVAAPLADASACDVPAYLRDTYGWAYMSPRGMAVFDRPWMVSTILFGNYRRLQRVFLEELEPGLKVLQAACVYGDFSENLAKFLGANGRLDVIDVAQLQVANCEQKLERFPYARAWVGDAATPRAETYDAITCFFLLHEVPDEYKRAVLNALLQSVRPGGKLVLVDYHRPHFANPLKALMSLVFDTLEPYAKSLWHNDITAFANTPDRFEWRKQTYFGGLYQKVVARCRGPSVLQDAPAPLLAQT
ncbi:MAG: rhodoquinone biosynthesis methyltransferase RquA [Gammaproteobacteria bacterium]|nr:rhodoquinone biosynthesis methyltransferase RquA [Gammaproteobacteria bacterium]